MVGEGRHFIKVKNLHRKLVQKITIMINLACDHAGPNSLKNHPNEN